MAHLVRFAASPANRSILAHWQRATSAALMGSQQVKELVSV